MDTAEKILRDFSTLAVVGASRHPGKAARVTDFMGVVMAGMSAKARNGHGLERLLQTARLASLAIIEALRD